MIKSRTEQTEKTFPDENGRYRRVLEFIISDEDAGKTVREFLHDQLRFSRRQISSLKYREDGIRVNDVFSRVTQVLHQGDVLTIVPKSAGNLYLDHGTFTAPPDILYEDNDLLIVNKPSGMVCHPSPGHYADTLANQAAAYASSKNENWTIRLVGRLDKDTSGIVIFAKNSETAALLSSPDSIQKTYYAIVCGHPGSGTVDLPIASDPDTLGKMRTSPEGKPAETLYETVRVIGDQSLLKIRIINGRTHQIRLHMAAIGFPLLGDPMYGSGQKGTTHAMLHCAESSFIHPFTKEPLQITATFPKDWPKQYLFL